MSKGKLACPECGHSNAAPAAGTKKITCDDCGMIIVMAKVYGENWAAGPSRPKILTRRTRGKAEKAPTEAGTEAAATGRKAKPAGRAAKGKAPHSTHGHGHGHADGHGDHHHHYHSPKETSPALIWGSVGGLVIVAVLVGVVLKNNSDKEALRLENERRELAARENPGGSPDDGGVPDIDALASEVDIPPAGGGGEKPAATTDSTKVKEPRKPRVKRTYDPFPVDGIDAAVMSEIQAAIATLKDLDATTARRSADDKLFAHRAAAIPVLINDLFALKLDDEMDVRRGWGLVQSLGRCSEHRTEWEMEFNVINWPEDADALAKDARNRRIMLQMWHKWWAENGEGWEPPKEDESFFDD